MVQELPPRGVKNRTMRIIKFPKCHHPTAERISGYDWKDFRPRSVHGEYTEPLECLECYACSGRSCITKPRHKIGDILYVRETFTERCCMGCCGIRLSDTRTSSDAQVLCPEGRMMDRDGDGCVLYKASHVLPKATPSWPKKGWTPSIHMPKAAARIFIRITGIKVQRPQELTIEEILAEGIDQEKGSLLKKGTGRLEIEETYESRMGLVPFAKWKNSNTIPGQMSEEQFIRNKWARLWDSLRSKKDLPIFGYDANPLCCVYEFEVMPYDE